MHPTDYRRSGDQELSRLRDAQERAGPVWGAIERRERAQEALVEARAGAADWEVRLLLGETRGSSPIKAAEERVREAKAEEERIRSVHDVLGRRIEDAGSERARFESGVRVAADAVIASSSEMTALLDRYAALHRELLETELMIEAMRNAVPHERRAWKDRGRAGLNITEINRLPRIAAWHAVDAALATDPDVPLPAVEAQVPPVAA